MSVFVLDTNKTPLSPCHEAKARKLLDTGKAAIFRRYPFTIILKHAVDDLSVPELRVKLDPGSKITGITVIDDTSGTVVFASDWESVLSLPEVQHCQGSKEHQGFSEKETGSLEKDLSSSKRITQRCCCGQHNPQRAFETTRNVGIAR